MRAVRVSLLATLVAASLVQAGPASVDGIVKGVLSVNGRPLTRVQVALVDLKSGAVQWTTAGQGGSFELRLPPGDYVAAVRGARRFAMSQGPSRVSVRAGREAFLRLEVVEVRPDAPQSSLPLSVQNLMSGALAPSGVGISPEVKTQANNGPCDPKPCPCPSPNPHSTCGDGN